MAQLLDKSLVYAIIGNGVVVEINQQACQHSTVVVHPTCNRKVVGSNPTAGFLQKIICPIGIEKYTCS